MKTFICIINLIIILYYKNKVNISIHVYINLIWREVYQDGIKNRSQKVQPSLFSYTKTWQYISCTISKQKTMYNMVSFFKKLKIHSLIIFLDFLSNEYNFGNVSILFKCDLVIWKTHKENLRRKQKLASSLKHYLCILFLVSLWSFFCKS